MEKQGTVTGMTYTSKVSGKGNPYKQFTFELNGETFKNVYFANKFEPMNGQSIRIVKQSKMVNGRENISYEGYANGNDQQTNGNNYVRPATAAPAPSGYARSDDTQKAIRRQWAIGQANVLISTQSAGGALGPKIMKDDAALLRLIGHYSSVLYAATETDKAFEELSGYTGQINEGRQMNDELPEDMQ